MKRLYIILIFCFSVILAKDLQRSKILISPWKFEIGDDIQYAAAVYDDENWEEISVPSSWEKEGFPGYDGYAWYRVKFKFKEYDENASYYLKIGAIDDCDRAYINGNMVGFTGSFPPDYITAYNVQRQYLIPRDYLNPDGLNVIAIRVYDSEGPGGIVWGDVGIYQTTPEISPVVELSGKWSFRKGDNSDWSMVDFDDSDWDSIFVPGIWQMQGYADIGFAWYRRRFKIDPIWEKESMILLLGKIDDMDETYLNGKLLGKTGEIAEKDGLIPVNNWEYNTLRAYYIPKNLLNFNGINTLAVRVYDGQIHGGIYEGPVGIVTRHQYLNMKEHHRSDGYYDFWDFLEDVFGK
ncbi:MAG: glycoside hydrolase [Candidatus Marinimicrobia bacterium]|nr:glycoside hydrolase [Candidatus Neomarinimicrobiota bacterium]